MKLPTLSGLLKKPSYTMILSILIAVMAWFVVINTAPDQERTVTVRGVPVDTSTNALASLGLNVIEGGDPWVSVRVKGRGAPQWGHYEQLRDGEWKDFTP